MTDARYTLPKGYLSASSIETLMRCPRQYMYRYIEGKVVPPGAAMATGSAVHKALETYYNDAMDSAVRITPQQMRELAASELDTYLDNNETSVTDYEREAAIPIVQRAAENYVDKIGQYVTPISCEQEVMYTMPCGVDIKGYLDLQLVTENGETGIGDYKVTSDRKKWSKKLLENSLQFNLYAMATGIGDIQIHNMIKDAPAKRRSSEVAPGVTTFGTDLQIVRNVFDGGNCDHVDRIVQSAAELITSGVFMPCPMDSWCGTPQWCGYYKMCRG